MNYMIKFVGGPLDGTYEFPNFSPRHVPHSNLNWRNRASSWGIF